MSAFYVTSDSQRLFRDERGIQKEDYGKLKHKCDDISCSSCDCHSDYFLTCVAELRDSF